MDISAARRQVRSMRYALAVASVFIGACATHIARSSGAAITRLDGTAIDTTTLTQRIEALTRAANVQGLTVTIFNDAEVVYSRAFGAANLAEAKPLRTDTEIYGASLSKAVFSVLVMKLVEQGVLDLDKPLQDYVSQPLWENRATTWHQDLSDLRSDPRYRRITARMSMSHTTGLPGWRWFEPDQKLRIHFEPGEKFAYSGEGMTLLQVVIEKITGKSLEELMQQHVFGPYGMTMSSYTWQPRFETDYAVGHASNGKVYPKDKDNAARAPSTLETTTDDLAKFIRAVLRRDGLTAASWNEMFKPQVRIRSRTQVGPGALDTTSANDAIELSYGLGWGLQRTPYGWGAFKEGHGDGFQHYSIVYPSKGIGVLLLSNSDNAESIFGHLLTLTIADTFTPLEWENYVPYDRAAGQVTTAIQNVTVIPMSGGNPSARQTVIVRGERIAQIGPAAQIQAPAGAIVVDGTGKYLIPGLFEMHAHMSKTRASALGLYVLHGVTTLRDQGSDHAEVLRWRREVRSGARVGPRMLIAGPYLESLRNIERMRRDPPESRVEPFERARIPIGSPADARRVIDSLAPLELDHFKIRTVQDRATYLALAEAAHAHGKRLVGHVVSASPADFLEAGQDGAEHGFPFAFDSLPLNERMAFWRQLAVRDVGVVPTVVVVTESVLRPVEYFRALVNDTTGGVHPLRPYLSAFMILDWREQVEEVTPQRRALFERLWPIGLKHLREMRQAGVRLMAGSDVAVLNIFPGVSLHEELRLFVDSLGMTPMEALASATRRPAEWLGLADSVGTIESGKVADLVLLDADPLADIRNTRHIAAVVLRGKLFRRAELDALLASVKAMPDQRVNDWVR